MWETGSNNPDWRVVMINYVCMYVISHIFIIKQPTNCSTTFWNSLYTQKNFFVWIANKRYRLSFFVFLFFLTKILEFIFFFLNSIEFKILHFIYCSVSVTMLHVLHAYYMQLKHKCWYVVNNIITDIWYHFRGEKKTKKFFILYTITRLCAWPDLYLQ